MTAPPADASRALGLCVTTRDSAHHVLGLAAAASRAGILTEIFLTGEGAHLLRDPRLRDLTPMARVSACEVSARAAGIGPEDDTGLTDKDFVTQWRNAEMVERCDRYLVL